MEMMTLTKEQRELKAMAPATAQAAGARVRELTPAQRRAVMFAQQQVLRARAAKKAKDERQAALTRMWQEEDSDRVRTHAVPHAQEQPDEAKEVSLREAIGHVLRDLRTRDHKTLREVSEKAGVSLGYLSEVERGQKEASSELLSSIAQSLGLSTAQMLRMVADYLDSVAAGFECKVDARRLFAGRFRACTWIQVCVHWGTCRNVNFGSYLKRCLVVAMVERWRMTRCLIILAA